MDNRRHETRGKLLVTSWRFKGKGTYDWEKPWTIGDMRQGANNWSLAGDSKVRELTTWKNRGQSET